MSVAPTLSVYDRLRPVLDAADLTRRLGLEERRVAGGEAYFRPLCHESQSGESLQVSLQSGRWNCKACQHAGVKGDLFALVEYVLTGGRAPTVGGGMTDPRRQALQWLCQQYGIAWEESRAHADAGLDVIHTFAMMAHTHLLDTPSMLEWVRAKWGFDAGVVESYGIGWMPNPILPAFASEANRPESREAITKSGLGWFDGSGGGWRTRFAGRITFPYLEHGRAAYLIGRATPWTPDLDNGARAPKYHKLSVYSEVRPYISKRVTNDHLYNETVMSSSDSVIVAEGVADAVALSSLGAPVVSPVTISFNATDLERFSRKSAEFGLERVEILFDNELSGSGNWAARRAGLQLVQRGIAAKVLTLPLGDAQKAARAEVLAKLGQDVFHELEASDPRERKEILVREVPNDTERQWIIDQVNASKIDAAEWAAAVGAGAAGQLNAIRQAGRDVIELEVERIRKGFEKSSSDAYEEDFDPLQRLAHYQPCIELVGWIRSRMQRAHYAGVIAKAAGKGVPKSEVNSKIAEFRKGTVNPSRKDEKHAERERVAREEVSLVVPPPERGHTTAAPEPAKQKLLPGQKPPPAAPGDVEQKTDQVRYEGIRETCLKAIEAKVREDELGTYVSQVLTMTMGFTAFRTSSDVVLVRGSERIPIGAPRFSPLFRELISKVTGLTPRKQTHGAILDFATSHLASNAPKVSEVSWSYVADEPYRPVYFPTGDELGRILRIAPGSVEQVRMSDVRLPVVAGIEFKPIEYVEGDGVERALELFHWTSITHSGRLLLVYWLTVLPILRRVRTVPIVRIEGGSSSGKSRTVDAVSQLVNGGRSSSVPTAAALISRLSTEMLTIDDNREANDITPAFLGTMLQATQLGAREKRKANSDTGTVVERVCGALLMNGIEPVHRGKSEVASRMLTVRCDPKFRAPDSPQADSPLTEAILENRNAFWSESARRCAVAMELDQDHGERMALQIEAAFGDTRIGRLSSYLRLMVFAWIAGRPESERERHLSGLPPVWASAFEEVSEGVMGSLVKEEVSVVALRYIFQHGRELAERPYAEADHRSAFDGKFVVHEESGGAILDWMRATRICRLARFAGKTYGAYDLTGLSAGQLEARIDDGLAFIRSAGFEIERRVTRKGRILYQVTQPRPVLEMGLEHPQAGDNWVGP